MSGSKFAEPPFQGSDWNRRLAGFVLAHQTCSPDEVLREWYSALCRNVRHWPALRESRISPTLEAAHKDCLAFVELTPGAQYCEGLVNGPDMAGPEPAIWAVLSDRVICFTHDVEGPCGMQGIVFDVPTLYKLRNGFNITGPYLFSDEPAVMTRCIPRPAQLRTIVRALPSGSRDRFAMAM